MATAQIRNFSEIQAGAILKVVMMTVGSVRTLDQAVNSTKLVELQIRTMYFKCSETQYITMLSAAVVSPLGAHQVLYVF